MRMNLELSTARLIVYPSMGSIAREKEVEELFAARGIKACIDFLAGHPGMPTRILGFPLPSDPAKATELLCDLIRSVYGFDAETEIEFAYIELAPA